jgi:GNAT superfamily N-acetyltransferase
MALATWWKNDPQPALPALPDFEIRLAADDDLMARLNRIAVSEIRARRSDGHRPYVGFVGGMPVTYGWVATAHASIGELALDFWLSPQDRYLWDFATLPDWQGKGLYPRLLQGIVQAEAAERFWIIHAPENLPSGAGMSKAGFQAVGQLSFRPDNQVALIPLDASGRAETGAALLGVPLAADDLSPCWRCIDAVVCTCRQNPAQCSCAIDLRAGMPVTMQSLDPAAFPG